MQTSDPHAIFWDRAVKPRPSAATNPRSIAHAKAAFCCANLGSARNLLGSRNQTSAIRGNKPTIDRARKAARPSASAKPRSIAHAKQFGHPRQRSHDRSRTQSSSAIRCNEPTLPRRVWPSCFACAIDRGFVAADGRSLVARS